MKFSMSAGYSRYVSLMKVILPVGIVLSIGLTLGWQHIFKDEAATITKIDATRPEIKENRMIRPSYASTDQKGQPYKVSADWAKQETNTSSELINPKGSMTMKEGETFNVSASKGYFDKEGKRLDLEGGVILVSTDGYKVTTENASISLDDNKIESNMYVEGHGPTGELVGGKGFVVEKREGGKKIITLRGPSRVVIQKSALKGMHE